MRTRTTFQYLAPGSKMPDDVTSPETLFEVEPRVSGADCSGE